ncbi:MAG: LemA family protein [archaeon]
MDGNRILPVVGIIVVVLLLMGVFVMGIYNGEVSRNQNVDAQWSNVETEYQKRFDLVPQLVNVVKGAANFEQETLTQLSELRTQWQTQTNVNDKIETANQFESTLSKLLLVAENYPTLQSNEQFQTLQIQLEGIENRISVERKKYNDTAREYNTYIQVFPNTFFLGGKKAKEYFESAPGSENAPEVPSDFTN